MRKVILWASALLLAVSCGGGDAVVSGTADLSPYLEGTEYVIPVKGESLRMAAVPGGTFAMGETPDQGRYRTPSIHQVILDGYAIGTAEVSQALWKAVMGGNPSPKDVPQAPVSNVTYDDAQKFLKKLSKETGLPFRLPTEAEWERAARLRDDMPGGVWEWCSDYWTEDLGKKLVINPMGPESGEAHALRGGSALEKDNKPISRKGLAPFTKAGDVGLRVAVSIDAPADAAIQDVLVNNKVARETVEDLRPETIEVNGVKFEMVGVEGGTFRMGGTDAEVSKSVKEDELPVHDVTLDNFKIGKHEVTAALWEAVTGTLPFGNQGPDYPVGNVSWYDAQAFIAKLNALTGRKFRLPTEAEWEYAARGGKKTRYYSLAGAPYAAPVAQYNFDDMKTRPVGRKQPNELGIHDMSGNAWEWVQDRHAAYAAEPVTNPTGPVATQSGEDLRIMRGGSAATTWDKCRVSNRNEYYASQFRSTIGFRLAL